jgi:translation initiation factor IF-3
VKPKLNHQIKSFEVRVVRGPDTGVMTHNKAMSVAGDNAMDLIEINPAANPPVCIIEELGKWKYEQSKKERASKQVVYETKTIQLRPVTDPNDLATKARQASGFLEEGHRVSVLMRFRGRELSHPEEGVELLTKFVGLCADQGQLDGSIGSLMGKTIQCTLAPRKR